MDEYVREDLEVGDFVTVLEDQCEGGRMFWRRGEVRMIESFDASGDPIMVQDKAKKIGWGTLAPIVKWRGVLSGGGAGLVIPDTASPRDSFAMAALTGMMALSAKMDGDFHTDVVVRRCYEVADAMLDERERGK